MSLADQSKLMLVYGPIIALLVLGFWLAVRSGGAELASWEGASRMAGNVSRVALTTAAWLVALAALHLLVGFRLAPLW